MRLRGGPGVGSLGPDLAAHSSPCPAPAAMKLMSVTREHAEKHYADLKDKPFFGGLCEYSACPAQRSG